MSRKEVVNRIRETIHQADPTATAILYGSEARGDARPDSDVDLLILLPEARVSPEREHDIVRRPIFTKTWL